MSPTPAQPIPSATSREQVAQLLAQSFADDLITIDDLESRLERAYRATTADELALVVADIPTAAATPRAPASMAPSVEAVRRIGALMSGHQQRLAGVAPRRMKLRSRLGYLELDLTEAEFQPGITEIDVRAFMGYVQILLPPDVHVESNGHAVAGFFALRSGRRAVGARARCTVRISGRATFGFAEVFAAGSRPDPDD